MKNIKLRQNYFIVKNPIYVGDTSESGKLFIPKEAKEKSREEIISKLMELQKLEILEVGPDCKEIKAGDKVFVNPGAVHQSTPRILVEKEDKEYFLFREQDVILIYEPELAITESL